MAEAGRMVGRRVLGICVLGVALGASLGCDEVVDAAKTQMWAAVSSNPGKINDMGTARSAMDNLVPPLVARVRTSSPPPPDEGEIVSVITEYMEKSEADDWTVPPPDALLGRISPQPAEIPLEPPPAPGE